MDSYGGAVGTSRRRRRGGLLPGAAGLPRSSSVAAPASAAVRRVAGVSFSLARQPRATTTPPRADGSNSLATHGLMDVVGVRGNDLLLPPLLPVTIWLRTTSGAAHLEICYYMIQFMPKKKRGNKFIRRCLTLQARFTWDGTSPGDGATRADISAAESISAEDPHTGTATATRRPRPANRSAIALLAWPRHGRVTTTTLTD